MSFAKWKNFNDLQNWYNFVDNFKISFNFKSGSFFNFEIVENFKQVGIFFNKFMPNSPTDRSTIQCALGNLQRRSLIIDPALYFASTEAMIRQGDLIKYNEKIEKFYGPNIHHVVVLSQTCDVQHKEYILVLPAYSKDEFFELELKKENLETFYENVRTNKVMHFIPYLPYEDRNEEYIVDLRQIATLKRNEILKGMVINSLSLQGLFYFQNRLAISQIRDLKDRDDLRVLRK